MTDRNEVSRMKKSLWSAQYRARNKLSNAIVTLDNGRIYGGNAVFYFTGTYDSNQTRTSARVIIKRYADGDSILGDIDEAVVLLSGTIGDTHIFFAGHLEDQPEAKFRAKMEKLADLE